MSRDYRRCLTAVIKQRLRADDFAHDFLTLGAMYDVPSVVDGRALCFSYHDGNLAQALKSPYCPRDLSTKRITEGLEFERHVYHGTHHLFAMSEYLRRSFIDDYGVSADRVSTIGAGINLDTVPVAQPDKHYDTKEILFVGSDFARKGGYELLRAFRCVQDKHKDAQLHVVGPKHVNASPEQSRGVHFYGFLDKNGESDRRTLEGLFSKCSLFVLPSLYEPFGIAPLEAMAHQIPAVVSRGWALEEMVMPGVTGMHVEPGSADDLAEQLDKLLSDPNSLERMGTAARTHVIERYTWPRVIERMIDGIHAVQRREIARTDTSTAPTLLHA